MRVWLALIACLLFFIIFVIPSVTMAQYTIGVSSTVTDLSTLEKGSNNIVSFQLVTSSVKYFLVHLNKERATLDFFSRRGYEDYLLNHSEEDVMDWVEFLSNPVEVEIIEEGKPGGIITGHKEINFILNVPKDAEPGYHIFRIKPTPVIPSEDLGQAGARVVSVTTVTFLFNVEGKAIRDGIILDVVPGGRSGNRFVTDTYFQNIGTTTINVRADQSIYKNGEFIAGSTSGRGSVRPGEVKVLNNFFPGDKFSEGEYEVRTSVNFVTGSVAKNSTIFITPAVLPPPEEKPKIPVWLIIALIVIVVIAILVYKW